MYGLQLIAMTGLPSGSVYPILIRLEERGLLRGELESVDAATAAGRRPRRYYSLRSAGADEARSAVDEWQRTKSLREASFGSRLRERPA